MRCTIHKAPTGNPLTDMQLFEFQRVAHLYDHQDPAQQSTYEKRANRVAEWFSEAHRGALVDALLSYGERIGATSIQVESAKRLLDPASVAVVTGQQAGLFTGPLYSVTKALSAIGFAEAMEQRLQRPVVPIFWVASEDHDIAEVDHAYILNRQQDTTRVALSHAFDSHQMVYHAPLTEAQIRQVLGVIQEELPESPYKHEMIQTLWAAFRDGESLSVWFARLMTILLATRPIVILDPCLPELRKLVAPVFANTLANFETLQENLAKAYHEVEELGIQPEVVRDEAHSTVFHVVDGKRYVLQRHANGGFSTRGLSLLGTVEHFVQLAKDRPDAFSSNVLLRPVVQDHLIPTLAYVGGPSELAYHPLSRAVFHTHGRTLPPLVMRARYRFATPAVSRTMRQWGLSFEDVRQPSDLVRSRVLQDVHADLETDMSRIRQSFAKEAGQLAAKYGIFGPQVDAMVQKQIEQHERLVTKLSTGIYRLAERRRSDDVAQLKRIEHWFWADGHEQERRLSPLNLWAELGTDFFASLPLWGNIAQPASYLEVSIEESFN